MTDDAQPVLVGNKVEAAIPYYMSREFVVTAQDAGEVIALENNIMVVQYKNGKRDSFSLDPVQQKNSAGGFISKRSLIQIFLLEIRLRKVKFWHTIQKHFQGIQMTCQQV